MLVPEKWVDIEDCRADAVGVGWWTTMRQSGISSSLDEWVWKSVSSITRASALIANSALRGVWSRSSK